MAPKNTNFEKASFTYMNSSYLIFHRSFAVNEMRNRSIVSKDVYFENGKSASDVMSSIEYN